MTSKPLSPIRKAWYQWKSLHLPWRKRFLIGMIPFHPYQTPCLPSYQQIPTPRLKLSHAHPKLLSKPNFPLGLDLQGNTFWEFRDTLNSHKHRMRRIVQYPPATHHSDINISPQWHQWLRHTRRDAPSLDEQSQDLVRQENLKVLARQADERWAAKGSFLDRPEARQPAPALRGTQASAVTPQMEPDVRLGETEAPQEVRWDGEVRAEVPGVGLKDAARSEQGGGETPAMQAPDQKKHYFNERPDGTEIKEKKYKDDPWKQARGAPSEDWKPAAWSPNSALKR
ncbi:NADH dehydrogenase [Hyphodiscus hymeniophilus]|uniref:NADH dehydrogenase n=1 Tax=Hyphodiscus hymeniophilus TaxID=353542 RepID=A0A9P7AZD6_9HELO|nr:NADH dehydrogenase [Hyphodiscus hymeniophilus]